MFESLKLFAAGVFRSWWLYVMVIPGAVAGFRDLYMPGVTFSIKPLGLVLWVLGAILIAAFKTFHDLRITFPTSSYKDAVGKRLHSLYYKLKPMQPIDLVVLLSEIEELLAENFPKEQFMFGSYCRMILPESDPISAVDPEKIELLKVKLRKVIARYEDLR